MNKIKSIIEKYTPYNGLPLVVDFEKSQGCWFVDKLSGKKYLDLHSQYGSQPLGWNHSAFSKIDFNKFASVKLANPDVYSEEQAKFVSDFAEIAPDFKKFFFIDGGALAVENALKAAFDWKTQKLGLNDDQVDRLDVIHFKQAFHGRSGYTLSLTNTSPNKVKAFPKFPWTRVNNPKITYPILDESIFSQEAKALDAITNALERNIVAAIILEPIQGEGGDNHFRPEFLQDLRKLANEYDTLLIFDEVQTGFGLTGKMWCYEHFHVVPDLLVFGKKTQVCGFAATEKLDEVENNVLNTPYRISSTWGGNIVDMVRFSVISQVIQTEDILDSVNKVGEDIIEELRLLPRISNVRGKGLMIAFDLDSPEKRNLVLQKLQEEALILPSGERSIRLRPHLDFNAVDVLVDIIKKVV